MVTYDAYDAWAKPLKAIAQEFDRVCCGDAKLMIKHVAEPIEITSISTGLSQYQIGRRWVIVRLLRPDGAVVHEWKFPGAGGWTTTTAELLRRLIAYWPHFQRVSVPRLRDGVCLVGWAGVEKQRWSDYAR